MSYEDALMAARNEQVRWISGHFDPLLAAHVRRLRELSNADERLFVVVTDSDAPLLPLRARAELLAALADVDCVVMKEGPARSELEDERITQEFVDLIVSKHREAATG